MPTKTEKSAPKNAKKPPIESFPVTGIEADLVVKFANESMGLRNLKMAKDCLLGKVLKIFGEEYPAKELPNGLVFEIKKIEDRVSMHVSSALVEFLKTNGAEDLISPKNTVKIALSTRMKQDEKEAILSRFENAYSGLGAERLSEEWRDCQRMLRVTAKNVANLRDEIKSSPVFSKPGKYIAGNGTSITVSSVDSFSVDLDLVKERFSRDQLSAFESSSSFVRIFSETPDERTRRQEMERQYFAKQDAGKTADSEPFEPEMYL